MNDYTLESYIESYLTHLEKDLGYSSHSIRNSQVHLNNFKNWAKYRGLYLANQVTTKDLLDYQSYTYHYQKKNQEALSNLTQRQRISKIKLFFSWLNRNNYILYNPGSKLKLAKKISPLPKYILTAYEVEKVMSQVDIKTQRGIRDRAILETLYSTGIRRAELTGLSVNDIDFSRGTLMVRQGKGRKDRLIPIGERALHWIGKYLSDVRRYWKTKKHKDTLFISNKGVGMKAICLGHLVRSYIKKADIGKMGSCHLFRHTMASLMLENGASIRYVQEMLGHARMDTTELYTHISISKLKDVHKETHPASYTIIPLAVPEKPSNNLESINQYVNEFLDFLKTKKGYTDTTLELIKRLINLFLNHSNIDSIHNISSDHYFLYENHVYNLRTKDENLLDSKTRYRRLYFVNQFFKYLFGKDYINFEINVELEKPHYHKKTHTLFTVEEIESLIDSIDLSDYIGIRDRAIFELFYSTGITRKELINLTLSDIDLDSNMVNIRRSRVIPITDRALFWIKEYLKNSRDQFFKSESSYLFLTQKSAQSSIDILIVLTKKYLKKAGLSKELTCHIFRESFKSFMSNNGADKTFINILFGKEKSSRLDKLKADLSQYHPGKMKIDLPEKQEETNELKKYLEEHLEWMRINNSSKATMRNRKSYVNMFISWCLDKEIEDLKELDKELLLKYQRDIYDESSDRQEKPLSLASKRYMLSHLVSFFSYLVEMNVLLYNPGADIELPKKSKSLPSNILTREEVKSILSQVDLTTVSGIRDKAILETLSSTGIRRKELASLRVCDINFDEASLSVRGGKGEKDRLIPIGEAALYCILKYINEARPVLLKGTKSESLFLTPWGTKISDGSIGTIVKEYLEKAGITKKGSSILFRHTLATTMLDNGADIRYIQQMLGHKRLETTQVYTHVSIGKLKEVHEKTHPARLKKNSDNKN